MYLSVRHKPPTISRGSKSLNPKGFNGNAVEDSRLNHSLVPLVRLKKSLQVLKIKSIYRFYSESTRTTRSTAGGVQCGSTNLSFNDGGLQARLE
jgi:hypothetical protein